MNAVCYELSDQTSGVIPMFQFNRGRDINLNNKSIYDSFVSEVDYTQYSQSLSPNSTDCYFASHFVNEAKSLYESLLTNAHYVVPSEFERVFSENIEDLVVDF